MKNEPKPYLERYSYDNGLETDYEVQDEYRRRRTKSQQAKQAPLNNELLRRWKKCAQ